MVNEILNGISAALKDVFPGCTIYSQNIEQGLISPCFFIQLTSQNQKRMLGRRSRMDYQFDIVYFPADENDNDGKYEVGGQAIHALEYISVTDGLLHGQEREIELLENQLHIRVRFSLFVMEQSVQEPFEDISITNQTKE